MINDRLRSTNIPSGTGLDQSIGEEIMFTSCIGFVRFTMIKPILRRKDFFLNDQTHPEMCVIVFVKSHNIESISLILTRIDDFFRILDLQHISSSRS